MQTDWVDWLPVTEFVYNNHKHSATGHSPFYLEYSHHLFVPTALWKTLIDNPSAEDFADSLSSAQQHTYNALHDATALMKQFADQKQKHPHMQLVRGYG
jgi:hypothetical protein